MVVCFICKIVLTNFNAFKGHLSLYHNKVDYNTIICAEENCGRKFSLLNSYKRHILTQHNSRSEESVSRNVDQLHLDNVDTVDAHFVNSSSPVRLSDDNSNEQASSTSQDIFDEAISLFIAGLYANDFLPRNVVQTIIDGFKKCVSSALIPAIKKNLEELSQNSNIPDLPAQTIINSITPLLADTWDKFSTEYKRLQYFEAQNFYIKPQSITIGQRLETVTQDGIKRLKPVICEQAFISLRLVLKQFFSLRNILSDTLKYMESLNKNILLPNYATENFIQGSYWKTVQRRYGDKIVIPLFLFYDDYEPGNVLGSRAGQHKLGAVYVSIPCLPPCRSSALSNIFLLLLFHSSDRSSFGNNVIFQCVIDELNYLSEHGVDIEIPDFKGKLYFELGLILGDNLGIHSMTGFLESFSANYPCRVCRVRKEVMKYQVEEDISLLRNSENYESDLLQNQPSETGIKEKCIWLRIKNFNLFDQVGIDSMHDILEGVAKYVMSILIPYFIRDSNFFTLEQLNYRLEGFDYGPDERNRPCSLSLDHLTHGNVRLSASEMLILVRYFGLLVAEFIPTGNEHWSLYLKLRTVVELLSLTAFSQGTEELLQTNITELNSMYISLCDDTLKPKFHNLLHYHTALKKFGPIISLWSMRFEAKHRIFKIASRASCNRRNLTWTLAIKHQLKLNEMFLKGELDPTTKTGPELTISSMETKYIIDNLPTFQTDKFVKVSWIKVSSTRYTKDTVINHALWGLRPWWWHACNVALHAACCALVARACVTVARLQRPFAALAALLFAVHPVHTEAVAGVVGRADVLACIFFLSSLLVYHRPASNKKCVWMSIVLGGLSMLAKETGITVLLFNLAFDFYRCWPFVKRSICSLKIEKKCTGLSLRTIKVVVSLTLLICLRLALLQGTWPTFSPQDNPAAFHPSFFVRLMTFCYLAAFNWWLVVCPWTLSHDWQMGSVPLLTSTWDPRNLLTCAAFGALLLLCYRCVADLEVQRHTPAVVGLLLLVVPFVPATNLLVTVGFVIAERVLYIPSVGSVIITAYGVQLIWYSKPGTKMFLVIGLAVLAASGVARTFKRNADWRDRATLLKADLVTLPQNGKLHYNFANFLRETEQQDGAIKHYKEALRLWPTYASAHNNLGTLVSGPDNAEHHFLQAIKYNKNHVNAHYNLGKLYKKSGRQQQAITMLEKCIWIQPRFVQAHVELLTLKRDDEKHRILNRLIELDPRNWEYFVLYGDWWRDKGLYGPAAKFYLEASRLSFRYRSLDKPLRGDLVTLRVTALAFRALGQKSRMLQLLTRWHTWRRGWPSVAAAHMYLRDWRLKMELEDRAQLYNKAVNPTKSTKCFNHAQLTVEPSKEPSKPPKKTISDKQSDKKTSDKKVCKKCGTKKRDLSISSQLKTTHNKSETGHKEKKCNLHRKEKNVKKNDVIPNIPIAEHILMKTF